MVHRLLTRYADGGRSASQDKYEELCEHCSAMEQLAASAERASIKYKQVEFMSDKLGQVFEGTVSGVTEFGLYVEINENKCEGMVPLRDLDDDYYEFDERNYCLWGRKVSSSLFSGGYGTSKSGESQSGKEAVGLCFGQRMRGRNPIICLNIFGIFRVIR